MAESVYLIWKLRCERVIQNNGVHATSKEINRWVATMNAQLKLDSKMTDRMFEKKAIPVRKVHTWKGILKGEDKLPDDWTGSTEVLVGIEPRRQQKE
jgi:hypothetical protein